jgi:hypothetical protein
MRPQGQQFTMHQHGPYPPGAMIPGHMMQRQRMQMMGYPPGNPPPSQHLPMQNMGKNHSFTIKKIITYDMNLSHDS